jgi:hypothetical protein
MEFKESVFAALASCELPKHCPGRAAPEPHWQLPYCDIELCRRPGSPPPPRRSREVLRAPHGIKRDVTDKGSAPQAVRADAGSVAVC